jgi:hypothetical protein
MRPTKREDKITAQIEADLQAYQASGGNVQQVPRGITADSPEGQKWQRDNFSINGVDGKRRFKK